MRKGKIVTALEDLEKAPKPVKGESAIVEDPVCGMRVKKLIHTLPRFIMVRNITSARKAVKRPLTMLLKNMLVTSIKS
jgi:hypothetical protein